MPAVPPGVAPVPAASIGDIAPSSGYDSWQPRDGSFSNPTSAQKSKSVSAFHSAEFPGSWKGLFKEFVQDKLTINMYDSTHLRAKLRSDPSHLNYFENPFVLRFDFSARGFNLSAPFST